MLVALVVLAHVTLNTFTEYTWEIRYYAMTR